MEIPKTFRPTRSKYLVFTADILAPLAVCLFVIVVVTFCLNSSYFAVNTVECALDYQPCQNESLLVELDKMKGQNIFTLDKAHLIARLTSGDFTIREASIKQELPSTVVVDLQSVYPVVALQVRGLTSWITLDHKYRAIRELSVDPNVPTVVVSGPLTVKIGKPVEGDSILKTLDLALNLARELLSFKSLTLVDENTIELVLLDGTRGLFTPQKDEQAQLRILQAILVDDTIEKKGHIIDVRFSQPVLRPY